MDTKLRYSDVPRDWAICYQTDCPLAENCLRRRVATLAPADLKHHDCVLPGARKGDSCDCFVENRPMRLARGMKGLLVGIGYEQGIVLREHLFKIFGSRSQYYRYYRGRWLISPSRQKRVAALFRQSGLDREPEFDDYIDGYYFDSDV